LLTESVKRRLRRCAQVCGVSAFLLASVFLYSLYAGPVGIPGPTGKGLLLASVHFKSQVGDASEVQVEEIDIQPMRGRSPIGAPVRHVEIVRALSVGAPELKPKYGNIPRRRAVLLLGISNRDMTSLRKVISSDLWYDVVFSGPKGMPHYTYF